MSGPQSEWWDELGSDCEECGEVPSTRVMELDGVIYLVCEHCLYWWMNHSPGRVGRQ